MSNLDDMKQELKERFTALRQFVSVYTCTDSPQRAEAYRRGKAFVNKEISIAHDPGDFGTGLYADESRRRASWHGRICFEIVVDKSRFLSLENPYEFEGVPEWLRDIMFTEPYYDEYHKKYFRKMKTVQLPIEERIDASRKIREEIMKRGYYGAYWGTEYVIFSDQCVVSIREIRWLPLR